MFVLIHAIFMHHSKFPKLVLNPLCSFTLNISFVLQYTLFVCHTSQRSCVCIYAPCNMVTRKKLVVCLCAVPYTRFHISFASFRLNVQQSVKYTWYKWCSKCRIFTYFHNLSQLYGLSNCMRYNYELLSELNYT